MQTQSRGEKSMTPTAQLKVELDRSFMDFTNRVTKSHSLSRSAFSIKNILNLQGGTNVSEVFDDAISSIPRSIVAPIPCKPSPLMSPCVSFGLPLYAPPVIWTSIGTRMETPIWTSNTNFMMNQFSSGFELFTNLQRRRISTKKKQRPLFSQRQVQTMEKEFTEHRYISESKRAELSLELDLTETQVKTWFQNRRTKWRKELRDKVATTVAQTRQKLQRTMSASETSSEIQLSPRCPSAFDICKKSQ